MKGDETVNKIDKNDSVLIFLKLLFSTFIIAFLCSSMLSLLFQSMNQEASRRISFAITFSLSYSLFATGNYKEDRLELNCEGEKEEIILKIEEIMKKSRWSIVEKNENQIVFKSSLFKTVWREYLTININENNLEIIGYKQFLEYLKEKIGLKKKTKIIYKIAVVALVVLVVFFPNIFSSINKNKKYESYDLALNTAIEERVGKDNYGKVVKLLEKNIGDKSIVILRSRLPYLKEGILMDAICEVEIVKKGDKYMYSSTPFYSIDYAGEGNPPYSLVEGVVEIDKDKNIYYGIGKIFDSSYRLVTDNKNYKELSMIEDNIFIIVDDERYEKIEFWKVEE